jgi:hypothetical protein
MLASYYFLKPQSRFFFEFFLGPHMLSTSIYKTNWVIIVGYAFKGRLSNN